ncbi:MAG: hypothetical protein ACYCVN_12360 [Acidimicrobiales bacterium]
MASNDPLDPEIMRQTKERERHERNLYNHGHRRGRYDADPDARGPRPAEPPHMDDADRDIYRSGEEAGRQERESELREGTRSRAKKTARRAQTKARRLLPTPVGAAVQLWHVVVVTLAMVGLYLALTSVSGVGSVVGGVQKAVAWLVSPTAVI